MSLKDLIPSAIELLKDGAQFAFNPIDDETGEIDLSEVSQDIVDLLKALNIELPENIKGIKLVIKTN